MFDVPSNFIIGDSGIIIPITLAHPIPSSATGVAARCIGKNTGLIVVPATIAVQPGGTIVNVTIAAADGWSQPDVYYVQFHYMVSSNLQTTTGPFPTMVAGTRV